MITKERIIEISDNCKKQVGSERLEKVLSAQGDARYNTPGIIGHYYRFLYFLAKEMKPKNCVELGTNTGISAACLADGNPDGKVITLDINQNVFEACKRDNIEFLTQDSLGFPFYDNIDILFIDTEHDGVRCQKEYDLYRTMMMKNSLIFFDDVYLNSGMESFWKSFETDGIKVDLPNHGKAGFGMVMLIDKKEEE